MNALHQEYTDASQFLRWLGHLLGWDHIWNTHKMIAGSMRGMCVEPWVKMI